MAIVTRGTQILIVSDAGVMRVHIRFVVRVASGAIESRKVTRNRMTLSAVTPAAGMRPGIDREVLRIMIPGRRRPTIRRMTICGKTHR